MIKFIFLNVILEVDEDDKLKGREIRRKLV